MKVLLVPNYSRPVAVQSATELSNWLESQDVVVSWAHDKKNILSAPPLQREVTLSFLWVAMALCYVRQRSLAMQKFLYWGSRLGTLDF